MAFYHPFMNIIRTIRSGAYFGQALQNNNCDSLREARDKDPNSQKLSTRAIYNGIIFCTSAIIATRSLYKWGKSKIKKWQRKKQVQKEKEQNQARLEALQNDNIPINKPIITPTPSTEQTNKIIQPSQSSKPVFVPKKDNTIIETEQEKDKFAYDNPLSSAGIELLKELKLFKNINDKNKFGTYYLLANTKNNEKIIMFNNSGIFTTNHKLLFNENNNLIDLSELLNNYNEIYHYDLCILCKYFLKA